MDCLALVFPRWRGIRLPFTRDQAMLSLAAVSQFFTALDIYLAHNISGGIKATEWIPILSCAISGLLLLAAGLIARGRRDLAASLATLVFVIGIFIGALGIVLHLRRTALSSGLLSLEAVDALIWAPPVIGPLFLILISILGISAAWIESPTDSGRLRLPGGWIAQLPFSKTRAYFLIAALFILASLISSILDHARFAFESPWVWLPLTGALFAGAAATALALIKQPTPGDIMVYLVSMLLLILIGVIGCALHAGANLLPSGALVLERFVRGSPLLAPLLFCNAGLLGLLILLPPGDGFSAS